MRMGGDGEKNDGHGNKLTRMGWGLHGDKKLFPYSSLM